MLRASEIVPGAVAYFDIEAINTDHRIGKPLTHETPRPGPFVCFAAEDGYSAWAPLTTQYRAERLAIPAEWRTGGSDRWQQDPIYLNDGAVTYVGSDEAFIDATRDEYSFDLFRRPGVVSEAVTAVIRTVESRHGRTL